MRPAGLVAHRVIAVPMAAFLGVMGDWHVGLPFYVGLENAHEKAFYAWLLEESAAVMLLSDLVIPCLARAPEIRWDLTGAAILNVKRQRLDHPVTMQECVCLTRLCRMLGAFSSCGTPLGAHGQRHIENCCDRRRKLDFRRHRARVFPGPACDRDRRGLDQRRVLDPESSAHLFLDGRPPRPLLAWVLVFRLLYCSGQAPSAWAYSALSRYISVRAPFSGCRRCFCPWYLSQAQSATPGSCKAPKDRPSYQKAPQCSACKRVAVQGVAPAIRPAMPAEWPAMTVNAS